MPPAGSSWPSLASGTVTTQPACWSLNPISHARTRTDMHRYKLEPYAVAADIYGPRPTSHAAVGPGTPARPAGCTASGSNASSDFASRAAPGHDPCIPKSWPGFEIALQHGASRYEIVVENPQSVQRGVAAAELDGAMIAARPLSIPLKDDGTVHRLRVQLG